jgi:membrane-associated protease RseP (regulator of RpoE activity)
MIGRAISLRVFAVIFALACAVFLIIAGYRALLVYAGPLLAPVVMAVGCGLVALSLLGLTHLRASRRKARLQAVVASLIDHKPMAALAAAVVAGAAARFGIEPEDLFPIFEAFVQDSQAPDTTDEATPPPASPTPQAHPSPPQQSIH